MSDLISRQEVIEHLKKRLYETALNNCTEHPYYEEIADNRVDTWLNELPSAQPESEERKAESAQNVPIEYLISRKAAIEAMGKAQWAKERLMELPSAQPTLCGYDIEHLILIANVLRKENLPPERITEALTDIGRIVSIVTDEFEESLRKAVEQCKI